MPKDKNNKLIVPLAVHGNTRYLMDKTAVAKSQVLRETGGQIRIAGLQRVLGVLLYFLSRGSWEYFLHSLRAVNS